MYETLLLQQENGEKKENYSVKGVQKFGTADYEIL